MNSVSWITGSEFFICQNEIDRDINASINIMIEGLRLYVKNKNIEEKKFSLT